jgi:hypothetical protein
MACFNSQLEFWGIQFLLSFPSFPGMEIEFFFQAGANTRKSLGRVDPGGKAQGTAVTTLGKLNVGTGDNVTGGEPSVPSWVSIPHMCSGGSTLLSPVAEQSRM